jgi:hypothetical protein
LGGQPGAGLAVKKSIIETLKIECVRRFASDGFVSYAFFGSGKVNNAKTKLKLNIDFFSPPLTCASCLGGINQGRSELKKLSRALEIRFRRGTCGNAAGFLKKLSKIRGA